MLQLQDRPQSRSPIRRGPINIDKVENMNISSDSIIINEGKGEGINEAERAYFLLSNQSSSSIVSGPKHSGPEKERYLEDHNNRYILVNNAWMPHTVRFFDSQICYLDSMNGYLYRSTKNIIGEFPPFARGLAYDGTYYYVGQSEVRNFAPLKGIKKLIAMTAGFYMFDDETKAAKFFNVPGVRQIHDLCVVKE